MGRHEALDRLREAGARREAAEQARAEAMDDIRRLAMEAKQAGVPVAHIAEAAGVTRPTVYALLEQTAQA